MDANEHPENPEDENMDHVFSEEDYDDVVIEPATQPLVFSKTDFRYALRWWGKHLFGYNFIMASTGIFLLYASIAMAGRPKTGLSFISIPFYIEATCWYALLANACFISCAGFLILVVKRFPELIPRMENFYQFFFYIGIYFSIGLNCVMGIINLCLISGYLDDLLLQ